MTRTDAINILKNEKPHCGRKIRYTEGDICEAFDMAINSLKVDEMYQLEKEDADEFIPKSVIEDIKAEIRKPHVIDLGELYSRSNEGILQFGGEAYDKGIEYALFVIDKHISGKENK